MGHFELISVANDRELAQAAVTAWLAEVQSAAHGGGTHTVALSGGRITKTFFQLAVEEVRAKKILLAHVHFFWADERCVAPTDAESNYRIANELFFAPLEIDRTHVHRIKGEEPMDFACAEAEGEICRVASLNGETLPMLDLIFLGLGEDGHVASLFPGEPLSAEGKKVAYRPITDSPKPPPQRITLTYAAIAAARQVWVLASGTGKEKALGESLKEGGTTPLARVVASRPSTRIFTDIRAATSG